MDIKFCKKDFWLAVLAGEIVAWLSLPTLKNLTILELLSRWGIGLNSFLVFWMFFVPAVAVSALYIFYLIAKFKNKIGFLQMGKYGIIGVLNTQLNAGIYNLLIFLTNIVVGFTLDLFFIIAFVITVTNSFFWNRWWAFGKMGTETVGQEAFKFFSVSAIVAIINTEILHLIINVIGAPAGIDLKIWANVALAFAIIVAFFGNFFGYKYIVFSTKKAPAA